jgi:hypothetical protein
MWPNFSSAVTQGYFHTFLMQRRESGRFLSGSGEGSDFSNCLGPDPVADADTDRTPYKNLHKFFQQEIFGPKKDKNVSILEASDRGTEPDPDPVPNLRIRNTVLNIYSRSFKIMP